MYKHFGIKKSLLFSFLVIALFFSSIEIVQRIRYFIDYKSSYWLLFGFIKQPKDYGKMMAQGISRRRRPDLDIDIVTAEGKGKYNLRFKEGALINSYGFRGKEFNRTKSEGVYRIVVLGGSTTFGLYCEDGHTYPEYLERILNSKAGGKYEVINAGVVAYDIHRIASFFKEEIIPLAPDMIIINCIFNNLYCSEIAYQANPISLYKINVFLLTHSLFYCTLREKLCTIFNQPMDELYTTSKQQRLNGFLKSESFWTRLEYSFRKIIHCANTHNIKTIIVKEPVILSNKKHSKNYILLDSDFEPVYRKIFLLLDKICEDKNVVSTDAFSYFNQHKEKDLFFDDLHLTAKGNYKLASLLAETVVEITAEKN